MENGLAKETRPWSHDVWSMGLTIAEVISSMPISSPTKSKTISANKRINILSGVLGLRKSKTSSNEDVRKKQQEMYCERILAAQTKLSADPKKVLQSNDEYDLCKDPVLMDLLSKMLCIDPIKRISPEGIL